MIARWRSAIGWVSLFAVLGGCATGESNGTAQNAAAVMGGTEDTTDTGVVGIVVMTNVGIATCSGSLLMPNLVLTARHCVSPMSSEMFVCQPFTDPSTGTSYQATTAGTPYPAGNFYVTDDVTIDRSANFVGVAEVMIPPNTTNVAACGKDVAMLRLAQPITTATILVPRLDSAPLAGEMFTAIGYGAIDGSGDLPGTRRTRSGLNVIGVGMQYAQGGIEVVADTEWSGDTGTCSGDSGGPAVDLAGQVMGSVSRGGANTCDQPTYSRVDSWADWIRGNAMQAASSGGFAAPSWVTPPVAGSAMFGQNCNSDAQCAGGLSCLIVNGQRICTDEGCNCPDGWICGDTQSAIQACVPDPNAGQDAGTPQDTGTTPTDSGMTVTDAGMPTTPDSGTSTMMTGGAHGGCSATPGGSSSGRGWTVGWMFALGMLVTRRRRARS